MFRSLRLRLAIAFAVVSLVILGIFTALVLVLLSRDLDHRATDQIEAEARAQVDRIQEGGPLEPTADVDNPSASAIQIAVYPAGSAVAVGEPKENPSWLKAYPSEVTDLRASDERVRVVTLPAYASGRLVARVAAGRSLEAEAALIDRVRSLFVWGGFAVLATSIAAGWWWAGRAVEPVERAYEAQAGFVADASHELRTPLAFIRAGVETLADADDALGAEVLDEVDYLTDLSRRLLELARADRGELPFERSPVDLAAACRLSAHWCTTASGTTLTLDGPDDLFVEADRVALEAALDAVFENVGRHGGGAADVRWHRSDGRAIVAIVDHGEGMPDSAQGRAFERFYRADPSRTRDTGGSGLGLPLARALVEAQEGRIWLEPTPGGGLTAKISLEAG